MIVSYVTKQALFFMENIRMNNLDPIKIIELIKQDPSTKLHASC